MGPPADCNCRARTSAVRPAFDDAAGRDYRRDIRTTARAFCAPVSGIALRHKDDEGAWRSTLERAPTRRSVRWTTRVAESAMALPSEQSVRGAALPACVLAPRANPRAFLEIGSRLALRSLAVEAEDVVADAQSAEPVQ
jgi:hypothetical protein